MKKSLRKIVSLVLVLAVIFTSLLVSSVGAATDPLQNVLIAALGLNNSNRIAFNTALNKADTGIGGAPADINGAAADISGLLGGKITTADAKSALEKYIALADDQKALIQANILIFSLNLKSYDGLGFNTIIDKVNAEITDNANDNTGVSLIIQILEYLNAAGKNGAWATDLPSNTNKIAFGYNSSDSLVSLAVNSFNGLISSMQTLQTKISSSTGATSFDKLLNYTAEVINTAPDSEIAALKTYLNGINDNYYKPYVAPSTSPVIIPSTGNVSQDVTDSLTKLNNAASGSGTQQNELKKAAEAAIAKEIANAGTTSVNATVSGNVATVTADQIKVDDIIAKADAVIAKAADIAKAAGSADVTIEKKVVIDVAASSAATVNVGLPSDLLSKVQEKGIDKVEISTGDVKLDVTPDFIAVKDSKSVSFSISKVAVTDELKAKMSDEQKSLLASEAKIFDFSAAIVSTNGTEKKVSNFDKAVTIKVKYALKAGESKDKITVLYLADDGTVKNMIGRYDSNTGEVVFETNHFSSYVIKNISKSFNDITKGAWYQNQAESLAAKGIVAGRAGNNFVPDGNITRAEFLTMLVKAKGVYDVNAACSFSDVSKDAWYYTYVASAVKAGITGGIGNNKFAPDSLITREQMAVMLANALGAKALTNPGDYLKFSDAGSVSSYAKNAAALCVKNEFIVGSNNKFSPKDNATRGMAAVVVYKYFNFIY